MRIFVFLLFVSSFNIKAAVTVGGVTYASSVTVKKDTLLLNGAGIREMWFIDLYAGGLYLKTKNTSAVEIINCQCTQAFKLVIISNLVTTDKFNDAIDEVFVKSTNGNTKHIDKRIAQFKKSLGTGLKAGDELFLIYDPRVGLKVFRNKKYKDTIHGMDFKKEMMKLWVGPYSVNKSLKEDLLGIE
jgi:hypothetical protein